MPRLARWSMMLVWLLATCVWAGDWPAFRGPQGNGVSSDTGFPVTWDKEKNIAWKIRLPGGGNSSPIVFGKRVFVTCASERGDKRGLYCYDRQTGNELWSRVVEFPEKEVTHETNPYCGSTPATDGERVVVWHGSAGLFCYSLNGEERWRRDLGAFEHIWGYGASPVIRGSRVFLNCGPGRRSFVTAIDLATGETIWQMDEPDGDDDEIELAGGGQSWRGSWSTPALTQVDNQELAIVSLPRRVAAFDLATGKTAWSCQGLGELAYTSVLLGDGVCVAMSGYYGPAIGFRPGGSGDITASRGLWTSQEKNPQRIGSGIIVGKHVFMANEPGLAQCLELESGKEVWQARLSGAKIWGSMVLAEGRFYVTDQEGTTWLFAPNPNRFEPLGKNELGQPSNSTPALADGQIYIRGFEHLWRIENRQ